MQMGNLNVEMIKRSSMRYGRYDMVHIIWSKLNGSNYMTAKRYLDFQVSVECMKHIEQPCAWYNQLPQCIHRNVSMRGHSFRQRTYRWHMMRSFVPSS